MTDQAMGTSPAVTEIEFYDRLTLLFHWLAVVLVVALFGTSLVWNYLTPHDRSWRPLMGGTHESIGILFAVLIVVRIIWRLTGMRRLIRESGLSGTLSRLMHLVLYLLLAAEIVLGFVLRWLQGEDFAFFGLFPIPAFIAKDRDTANIFENLHNWVGWAIVILSAGHAIEALFQHYALKDHVLQKMLWRRTTH